MAFFVRLRRKGVATVAAIVYLVLLLADRVGFHMGSTYHLARSINKQRDRGTDRGGFCYILLEITVPCGDVHRAGAIFQEAAPF